MITLITCLIGGLGAGIGTGLAGLSAAAVISPMLITFLGMPAYQAVGIALASDVLASAVSAYTYGKNKNLDIKNGLIMMMTFLVGLKFIIKPVMTTKDDMEEKSVKTKIIQSILCGIMIGFICGFVGAGGGMMLLLILTSVLGYELKTAVGTSVFIMTFTALTGAMSHFAIGGMPDFKILILCMLFTFVGAQVSAKFANKSSEEVLNRVLGIVLCAIGALMIVMNMIA